MRNNKEIKDLSIVVSVYNEEEVLNSFYTELYNNLEDLKIIYEIIFVNDGSVDCSEEILEKLKEKDNNVHVINFSRNFGHEAAMIAGIDYANGKSIICMDSDLQHPPSEIKNMYNKYLEGYDIINMVRTERKDASLYKRITSKLFYLFLNKISPIHFEPNASDFFLISDRVAKNLKIHYRERVRFLRGYIQIIGFKKTTLEFVAPKRFAGESKYSFMKLLLFSFSTIVSFSKLPLRMGVIIGIIFGLFSFVVGIYSIIMKIAETPVSGYTTIVVLISFMFSIQFLVIGVIGEYLGYLFDEQKQRPIYLIDYISNKEEK